MLESSFGGNHRLVAVELPRRFVEPTGLFSVLSMAASSSLI